MVSDKQKAPAVTGADPRRTSSMNTTESIQGIQNRGGSIEQIRKDTFLVQSFTDPETHYDTNPVAKTCNCGAGGFGRCVKHVVLADAVSAIPAIIGSDIAVKRVTDLCHKIFTKPAKSETFVDSYRLLHEVLWNRHATSAMKIACGKRHARIAEIVSGLAGRNGF